MSAASNEIRSESFFLTSCRYASLRGPETQLYQPIISHLDAIFALDAPEFIGTSQHGPVIFEYEHANIYGWDPDWDNLVNLESGQLEATPPSLLDKYLMVPLNENLESGFNESYMGQAGAADYIVFDKPNAPILDTNEIQPDVVVDAITTSAPVAEDTTVPAPTAALTDNEDRIQCTWPDCNATFGRPSEMRRHLKKHLPHSFECEVEGCSKTFYRKDKLEHHHANGHKDRYPELDQAARYQ